MITLDTWTSVVVLCQQMITEYKTAGISDNLQFMDWENHANNAEPDNVDMLGPNGLGVTEVEPGLFNVVFGVGVSTFGEGNVFRLRNIVARVFERLRIEKEISLIDPTTGAVKGLLKVVDGSSMLPMSRSTTRPYQLIQVECVVILGTSTTL